MYDALLNAPTAHTATRNASRHRELGAFVLDPARAAAAAAAAPPGRAGCCGLGAGAVQSRATLRLTMSCRHLPARLHVLTPVPPARPPCADPQPASRNLAVCTTRTCRTRRESWRIPTQTAKARKWCLGPLTACCGAVSGAGGARGRAVLYSGHCMLVQQAFEPVSEAGLSWRAVSGGRPGTRLGRAAALSACLLPTADLLPACCPVVVPAQRSRIPAPTTR